MLKLIQELKRRKVFRVAGVYAVVAWIIMQIGEVTFPALLLPEWALTLVIVLLLIGFPIAILLSWAFDITPDGIKRDPQDLPVSKSVMPQAHDGVPIFTAPARYRKVGFTIGGLAALALIGWLLLPQMGLFGLQPDTEANSLAVLNFENLRDIADKERLGQIIQELIITDLSESQTFRVFSSQRLFDLQNQLGHSGSRSIDPSVALEVARMAGASTLLTGNIIQTGQKTILTSRLIEVDRGTVIKSQRVEGEDIYALVDELTSLMRMDLNLSSTEVQVIEIPVAEKTTTSMTAYQHYLEGIDLFNEQKFKPAIEHFQQAIQIDSSFTNVYYTMAMAQWWAQSIYHEVRPEAALQSLNTLLKGELYQTTKEKLLAEGAYELFTQNFTRAEELFSQLVNILPYEKDGWYGLGEAIFHGSQDLERAQEAFEKVLELDPDYKLAYRHIFDIFAAKNLYEQGRMQAVQFLSLFPESPWGPYYLGLMTAGLEDYQRAAELFVEALTIDQEFVQAFKSLVNIASNHLDYTAAITLANDLISGYPNQTGGYEIKGYVARTRADYTTALKAFEAAYLIKPSGHNFGLEIGFTYQMMGLYDTAEEKYNEIPGLSGDDSWESATNDYLVNLYSEQGQYRRALDIIRQDTDTMDLPPQKAIGNLIGMAFIANQSADYEYAHALIDSALSMNPSINQMLNIYLIKSLICSSQDDSTTIRNIIEVAQNLAQNSDSEANRLFMAAMKFGYHATTGNYQQALEYFTQLEKGQELRDYLLFQKGLIFVQMGEYDQALAVADEMASLVQRRNVYAFAHPRAHLLRGRAHEALGNLVQARQNYQRLMGIWRNGDESSGERQDLLNRIVQLNRQIG